MPCPQMPIRVKTMPVEIELFGFFAPTLLLVLGACVIVFIALDLLLARLGVYRLAWHPGLFRVALFAVLFCGVALLVQRT
jgi:protein AaeX